MAVFRQAIWSNIKNIFFSEAKFYTTKKTACVWWVFVQPRTNVAGNKNEDWGSFCNKLYIKNGDGYRGESDVCVQQRVLSQKQI